MKRRKKGRGKDSGIHRIGKSEREVSMTTNTHLLILHPALHLREDKGLLLLLLLLVVDLKPLSSLMMMMTTSFKKFRKHQFAET